MSERDDYESAEFFRELGNRLREVRKLLELTEEQAASAAGITVKRWRRWEAGLPGRGLDPLRLLCKNLEISAQWLVAGEGFPFLRKSSAPMYARGILNDAGIPFRGVTVWH
jgi:transcriptional regulator with XRE-family HTH domain